MGGGDSYSNKLDARCLEINGHEFKIRFMMNTAASGFFFFFFLAYIIYAAASGLMDWRS